MESHIYIMYFEIATLLSNEEILAMCVANYQWSSKLS